MRKTSLEADFQKFFIKDSDAVLKRCEYISHEYTLYSAYHIITRDFQESKLYNYKNINRRGNNSVGRIDLIFIYREIKYIAEIKYLSYRTSDFWDAMKILGYVELYKFQTDDKSRIKPAIIIPADKIKLEHQLIAGKLGITIFLIHKEEDTFTMKKLEDTPHWKQ